MDIWDKKFKRASDCAFREIEGEIFVVSSRTGGGHLLNEVGTFIWSKLDGSATVDELTRAVTEKFDVDIDTAKTDTRLFMEDLSDAEIVAECD